MKNLFLWTLTGLALLAGCKKDSTTPTTEPSARTTALVNKNWKMTAVTAQQGALSQDRYASLLPCEKDNYIRFNDSHTTEANEGALKCSLNDPQTYAGRWELINNESQLLVTTTLFGSFAANTDIVELSATRMVLRGTVIDGAVTTVVTATFTAN
ncbi:lipocalin family protein [Hymenobacter daeguensis]